MQTNQESMTFPEWLGAAGLSDKQYVSMLHEQCVIDASRQAWMRGEDPTEYRQDHSSLETFYWSWKHGQGQNPQ
jgi:hypothetical protein